MRKAKKIGVVITVFILLFSLTSCSIADDICKAIDEKYYGDGTSSDILPDSEIEQKQKQSENDSDEKNGQKAESKIDTSALINERDEDSGKLTVEEICENTLPAMVAINITYTSKVSNYGGFFGQQSQSKTETASGTGIIILEDETNLYILTNQHVVSDAEEVYIVFVDDEKVEGLIKSYDKESDLALLTVKISDIKEETKSQIKCATLGDSTTLKLGESVVAIGNALGYGQSVTTGIVSALNRDVTDENGTTRTMIQTDAAINPGNSGGALLNMYGEVIGINESKIASSSVDGVGFAIPMSSALETIAELQNYEPRTIVSEKEKGLLGLEYVMINSTTSYFYNIPVGAYISTISIGGAAEEAGLQQEDVIVKFGDYDIDDSTTLSEAVAYYRAGETAKVKYKRLENNEWTVKETEVVLQSSAQAI